MKIETRTDIVQTLTITFSKEEKVKALDYCFDNDLVLKKCGTSLKHRIKKLLKNFFEPSATTAGGV